MTRTTVRLADTPDRPPRPQLPLFDDLDPHVADDVDSAFAAGSGSDGLARSQP